MADMTNVDVFVDGGRCFDTKGCPVTVAEYVAFHDASFVVLKRDRVEGMGEVVTARFTLGVDPVRTVIETAGHDGLMIQAVQYRSVGEALQGHDVVVERLAKPHVSDVANDERMAARSNAEAGA